MPRRRMPRAHARGIHERAVGGAQCRRDGLVRAWNVVAGHGRRTAIVQHVVGGARARRPGPVPRFRQTATTWRFFYGDGVRLSTGGVAARDEMGCRKRQARRTLSVCIRRASEAHRVVMIPLDGKAGALSSHAGRSLPVLIYRTARVGRLLRRFPGAAGTRPAGGAKYRESLPLRCSRYSPTPP
jgi:hypothetical protein